MAPLHHYLIFSAIIFSIGLAGALTRRNIIIVLISIEMMLAAANINFIAFWRYLPHAENYLGQVFTLFSITIAGAEAAVGLALVINIYRFYKSVNVEEFVEMKN